METHTYPVMREGENGPYLYIGPYRKGCRCDGCRQTWKQYRSEYHARRLASDSIYREQVATWRGRIKARIARDVKTRSAAHLRPSLKVGHSGWVNGCRCAECVSGHTEYKRRQDAMRGLLVPGHIESTRAKNRARRKPSTWPAERRRALYDQIAAAVRARIQWVYDLKTTNGCADCGYNAHAVALDFDHVHGVKLFTVGPALKTHSQQRIREEIAKCEVVCANCHRVRTWIASDKSPRRKPYLRKPPSLFETEVERKARDQHREHRLRRWRAGVERVAQYKLAAGCIDCGYNAHAVALDMDHVRGTKTANVARLYAAASETLEAELAKCDVVCANCHRIRTAARATVARRCSPR